VLTADLVRARVRGATLAPSLVDPGDPEIQEIAGRIVDGLAAGAAARTRLGEAVAEIEEAVGDLGPAKVARGMLRIAQGRCETELAASVDPATLRYEVFTRAAARGPLRLDDGAPDPFGRPTAAEILAEVGRDHELDAEGAAEALYGDLPTERRLSAFAVPDATWLVHRYNVALVQALLSSATGIRLALERPEAPRMRQLVRWIKFHQLLHTARRDGELLEVALDGPVSLFGPSTRYGQQLARFFPALLLQPGPWRMEATVLWTKARHRKQLVVTDGDGLRSHYADTGAYRTRAHEQFVAQFADKDRGWALHEGELPLALGDRGLVFPDFTLRRGAQEVHLEVLGYWKAEALEERLALLDERGPRNLIVAVSRKLRGDKGQALPEHPKLVAYAEVLPIARILEAAEAVPIE
jgi:uncharacterized protein